MKPVTAWLHGERGVERVDGWLFGHVAGALMGSGTCDAPAPIPFAPPASTTSAEEDTSPHSTGKKGKRNKGEITDAPGPGSSGKIEVHVLLAIPSLTIKRYHHGGFPDPTFFFLFSLPTHAPSFSPPLLAPSAPNPLQPSFLAGNVRRPGSGWPLRCHGNSDLSVPFTTGHPLHGPSARR